jgi:hypothetical protein
MLDLQVAKNIKFLYLTDKVSVRCLLELANQ